MPIARKTAAAGSRSAASRARPAAASRDAAKSALKKEEASKARQPSKKPRAPAAAKAAKADKADKADKAEKADKPRKPKLVRDSFTIPKNEYAVLEQLKERAARAGRPAKKSELLRAGIQALAGMADPAFLGAVSAVPSLKTGRPPKA